MDMMKHITGLFDEHGDGGGPRGAGSNMKITALCTIGKPAWLRRGPSVILPPSFSFIWRIPIRGTHSSDE
jgi:hypothetical protein